LKILLFSLRRSSEPPRASVTSCFHDVCHYRRYAPRFKDMLNACAAAIAVPRFRRCLMLSSIALPIQLFECRKCHAPRQPLQRMLIRPLSALPPYMLALIICRRRSLTRLYARFARPPVTAELCTRNGSARREYVAHERGCRFAHFIAAPMLRQQPLRHTMLLPVGTVIC
jgi:hypothetical protein